MTKNRVIVIGIDGLDANLCYKFKDNLPNLFSLVKSNQSIKMSSVFPPDSPTAWASILTGLNPANHGIISFKDPLHKSKVGEYRDLTSNISGRTFWDLAGKFNKKCCIIFPHLAYPPWPVNGILVSRTTEVDIQEFNLECYPKNFPLKVEKKYLKPITSYPIDPGEIISPTKKMILNEVNFGINLFKTTKWDIFFIYFSALDNIEHIFWMYFDEDDPEHLIGNKYKDVIPYFYMFFDKYVIKKFIDLINDDDTILILSDHGHAMRPYNLVNINEHLLRNKLLKSKISHRNLKDKNYVKNELKRSITGLINNNRLCAKLVSKLLKIFPQSLDIYSRTSVIDWSRTHAYLSDPSAGLKAYSYAGIRVKNSDDLLKKEKIIQSILNILPQIKDPKTGISLLKWIKKREEVYFGQYIKKYPDILFELIEGWGIGWNVNCSLTEKTLTHKIQSGNHRQDSAVFIIKGPKISAPRKKNLVLMDITPTILKLLGLDGSSLRNSFDGESVV